MPGFLDRVVKRGLGKILVKPLRAFLSEAMRRRIVQSFDKSRLAGAWTTASFRLHYSVNLDPFREYVRME